MLLSTRVLHWTIVWALVCVVTPWSPAITIAAPATATKTVNSPTVCQAVLHGMEVPVRERNRPTQRDSLTATNWRLVEFRSMSDEIGTVRPADPSLYTMRLHADSTVTMRLNCNRATGAWTAEPSGEATSGRFAFGPLATTRALCPPPSLDEQIASHAEYVRSYLLKQGRLYLSLMADGGVYVWEPAPAASSDIDVPAAPEEGGPRNWTIPDRSDPLPLRDQPSLEGIVVARYDAGTIVDNLGCQSVAGRIWCDVQPLGGGPRGYVDAAFLEPAVSPDGSVATGPDDSALRAGKGEFDATGHIPCAQAPSQPMTQCGFGVARAGGGYATVVVTRPDGSTRALYFRMGVPVGANTAQADGHPVFRTTKNGDLHRIRVGPERYEIPEAIVLGG